MIVPVPSLSTISERVSEDDLSVARLFRRSRSSHLSGFNPRRWRTLHEADESGSDACQINSSTELFPISSRVSLLSGFRVATDVPYTPNIEPDNPFDIFEPLPSFVPGDEHAIMQVCHLLRGCFTPPPSLASSRSSSSQSYHSFHSSSSVSFLDVTGLYPPINTPSPDSQVEEYSENASVEAIQETWALRDMHISRSLPDQSLPRRSLLQRSTGSHSTGQLSTRSTTEDRDTSSRILYGRLDELVVPVSMIGTGRALGVRNAHLSPLPPHVRMPPEQSNSRARATWDITTRLARFSFPSFSLFTQASTRAYVSSSVSTRTISIPYPIRPTLYRGRPYSADYSISSTLLSLAPSYDSSTLSSSHQSCSVTENSATSSLHSEALQPSAPTNGLPSLVNRKRRKLRKRRPATAPASNASQQGYPQSSQECGDIHGGGSTSSRLLIHSREGSNSHRSASSV